MSTLTHEFDFEADDYEDDDLPDIGRYSFHHELRGLATALLKVRALQAFDKSATRYPIYRFLRCAVRGELDGLLDDLALNGGLAAHRVDASALVLDGPGILIQAKGKRRRDYCSCTFDIWAVNKICAEQRQAAIMHLIGERRIRSQMFILDWHFASFGGVHNSSFEEIADDILHDEAYPMLDEPVASFIERYLTSKEAVLVLQGPPGTGKTRLVRALLGEMSRRKGENAHVMYTADKRAAESDRIFLEFLTGSHDAFVVEDADHLLMARTRGNQDLHRFLAISDGVVRAQGRKVIFTTNLPNVGDIDDALLRPGRCFASLRMRLLNRTEAERLIERLCADQSDRERALSVALPAAAQSASLAVIYRACESAAKTARHPAN
jgi:hypothetical protein